MTRRAPLLAALGVLALTSLASAQTVNWKMADEYPATSIQGEADARFARAVRERTGGRVLIANEYDATSGFRSKDMLDAIARGTLTIGNTFMGALASVDPVFQLPSLPFLASTPAQARALAAVARPAFETALARHNQVLLFLSPWPPAGLWARTPVTAVDALKGLRVRTSDASGVLAFKAAGAEPVQVSFADAVPMLKAGRLDAVVSSGDGGAGSRFSETLRHFTAIEYAVMLSMVTVNLDAWRALAPALREAVLAAAEATEARQWQVLNARVAASYAQMRAAGVGITTELSPAYRDALRAAGRVAIDDWVRKMGPAAAPILDAYKRRLASR